MKITGLKVYVVDPSGQQAKFGRTWTFVQVETDGGLIGTGECTNYPGGGSLITGNTVHSCPKCSSARTRSAQPHLAQGLSALHLLGIAWPANRRSQRH